MCDDYDSGFCYWLGEYVSCDGCEELCECEEAEL